MKLNKIYNQDCVKGMKKLKENSIDAIVTDPPYGLEFMGKEWDSFKTHSPQGAYEKEKGFKKLPRFNSRGLQDFTFTWATEAYRVLKPGGFILSFGGTRTYHRMACAIEDAGFEIRDQIQWLYGSGFPKSLNVGKAIDKLQGNTQWEGWGTALKPANEPICMARKPLSEKNVALNVLKWGTGAINIDGCRIAYGNETDKRIGTDAKAGGSKESLYGDYSNVKDKDIKMYKQQGRFPANIILDEEAGKLLDEQSGILISKWGIQKKYKSNQSNKFLKEFNEQNVITEKFLDSNKFKGDKGGASRFFYCPKPIGRFPANVILDGEAGKFLDEQSGKIKTKRPFKKTTETDRGMYGVGLDASGQKYTSQVGLHYVESGASRFFYCSKASKAERNAGCDHLEYKKGVDIMSTAECQKEKGRNPDNYKGNKNSHPTVKPINLMRYLVRLVTPPGGVVLDPFIGSGTTPIAAYLEKFDYIGFELDPEYFKIAKARIKHYTNQKRLF